MAAALPYLGRALSARAGGEEAASDGDGWRGSGLRRVGLADLYERYGFHHPNKKEVDALFASKDSRWG